VGSRPGEREPGPDTIAFSSLFDSARTITLTGGQLTLTDKATPTITGTGAYGRQPGTTAMHVLALFLS
jgi:hypothetical protein